MQEIAHHAAQGGLVEVKKNLVGDNVLTANGVILGEVLEAGVIMTDRELAELAAAMLKMSGEGSYLARIGSDAMAAVEAEQADPEEIAVTCAQCGREGSPGTMFKTLQELKICWLCRDPTECAPRVMAADDTQMSSTVDGIRFAWSDNPQLWHGPNLMQPIGHARTHCYYAHCGQEAISLSDAQLKVMEGIDKLKKENPPKG
jgi:hypothetical protein